MNIENILNKYIDNNYKLFHEKICNTKYEILGIKIPILRTVSKELLKEYDYRVIKNNLNNKYYEHVMLEGLLIANNTLLINDLQKEIDNYITKIDNWAICDIFVSELKIIKKNKEIFFKYIDKYLTSDKEYTIRFGIVVLLNYYLCDNYIDYVLNKLTEIKCDYYYVKMAISWCISIAIIKYFDKAIIFLNKNRDLFDKWTYNKALQKGIESKRLNEEEKKILKSMKK